MRMEKELLLSDAAGEIDETVDDAVETVDDAVDETVDETVDLTLIDEMLLMNVRERLLSNDRVLRTVEKLELGFAAVRSHRDPR